MRTKSDPPTQRTYIGMIISLPFIFGLALWMQDDLTPHTATLVLSVTSLFYLNLRWIQDFLRPGWRVEYEQKLAHTLAKLGRSDLTLKKRRRLELYRDELPLRFHLVTSPTDTYQKVNVVGYALKAGVSVVKFFWR